MEADRDRREEVRQGRGRSQTLDRDARFRVLAALRRGSALLQARRGRRAHSPSENSVAIQKQGTENQGTGNREQKSRRKRQAPGTSGFEITNHKSQITNHKSQI